MSPLWITDRPRPVGTPVRWERAVHREGIDSRSFHFALLISGFICRFAYSLFQFMLLLLLRRVDYESYWVVYNLLPPRNIFTR
jgi:hypothetical protein